MCILVVLFVVFLIFVFCNLFSVKRLQDKEKLKDYDKTRLQVEQLLEFKARIMDSQAQLQRDLQKAKQDAREAIEAREQHAEEMADLAETVEMATLDKEMAEEKVSSLRWVAKFNYVCVTSPQ